ncbi:ribokinase [Paenibacillus sp. J31TS4]|uniref:ribokinase n=1 Tax=Paenibacillus sp. J31TS4 TaxID=2807195 RepID=UPI001B0CF817|nr:ribokinase [Paenibacillus sp. J31TS4]GIP40217.1 ribokinase [Paenibacillus sp. J31TS4]
MKNGSVLVIGSLNMDLVAQVGSMPRRGETILGHSFAAMMGGKGSNQAVAAARLGSQVALIGCLGSDEFGESMQAVLRQERIETGGISQVENVPSGAALVCVDPDGDNSIVVVPGANSHLTARDIDRHADLFQACDVVVLQMEIPVETVVYSMAEAKRLGKTVILNLAPSRRMPVEALRHVDYLVVNEVEAEELTGVSINQFDRLVEGLAGLPCRHVILTLGAEGVAYLADGRVLRLPAYRVQAVDTTGAGDSFVGAFASRLARGDEAEEAVAYAVKVAAITVTRLGAQAALPTEEEIRQFEQVWGVEQP